MAGAGGELLASIGMPAGDLHGLPTSEKRFADGAHYRIEIPSTEGPRALAAALEAGDRLGVSFHRVSQGSGVNQLTDAELDEMAAIGAEARVEVSLFARPNASWGLSALARAPAGGVVAAAAHGQDQVGQALDEIRRAAYHGIRSVLIADLGLLSVFGQLRESGALPSDMQAKVSVMLPATNPASAAVLVSLGADTLNLPTDLSLAQIAAIRAVIDGPIDFYVESPDSLGGFVRLHEIGEIVRVGAPVYLKFGLRNAPDIYPTGGHLESTAMALTRERVRRARLGLEILERQMPDAIASERGAEGLALPTVDRVRGRAAPRR